MSLLAVCVNLTTTFPVHPSRLQLSNNPFTALVNAFPRVLRYFGWVSIHHAQQQLVHCGSKHYSMVCYKDPRHSSSHAYSTSRKPQMHGQVQSSKRSTHAISHKLLQPVAAGQASRPLMAYCAARADCAAYSYRHLTGPVVGEH